MLRLELWKDNLGSDNELVTNVSTPLSSLNFKENRIKIAEDVHLFLLELYG